jgi:hypothetical protein
VVVVVVVVVVVLWFPVPHQRPALWILTTKAAATNKQTILGNQCILQREKIASRSGVERGERREERGD